MCNLKIFLISLKVMDVEVFAFSECFLCCLCNQSGMELKDPGTPPKVVSHIQTTSMHHVNEDEYMWAKEKSIWMIKKEKKWLSPNKRWLEKRKLAMIMWPYSALPR